MVVEKSLPQTTYMLAYNFVVFHVWHDLDFVSSQQLTIGQTDNVESQSFPSLLNMTELTALYIVQQLLEKTF